jgi:hypothetical protein
MVDPFTTSPNQGQETRRVPVLYISDSSKSATTPLFFGENPSVKSGFPLTIEWEHETSARLPINDFEQQRSKHVREHHAAGHSDEEIKEAAHHASRGRCNRRIMTYTGEITSAVTLSTELPTCWIERFEASSASTMHKMFRERLFTIHNF